MGTEAAQPPIIVSIGADLNPAALESEIRAEVARKRREGVYPVELLRDITADKVHDAMLTLYDSNHFSFQAPTGSNRTGLLGFLIQTVKRAIAKVTRWHTKWLVGQQQTFASSAVSVLSAMEQRLLDQERRLLRLETGEEEAGPPPTRIQHRAAGQLVGELAAAAPGSLEGLVVEGWLDRTTLGEGLRLASVALAPGAVLVCHVEGSGPEVEPVVAAAGFRRSVLSTPQEGRGLLLTAWR